jgi:acyl-coenzyme A synthetase/AMP-(fatty) acid ligase
MMLSMLRAIACLEMEEVVASHHYVAECAVIGINDELKVKFHGVVVIKLGTAMEHYQLEQEIIKLVRQQIGAVAPYEMWSSYSDYLKHDRENPP